MQQHTVGRWFKCASAIVACVLMVPCITPAYAQEPADPGFGRYRWLVHEADVLVRSYEFSWFDAEAAANAACSESLTCDGTHFINKEDAGASDHVALIADLYAEAAGQRVEGDWSGASVTIGEIAHRLADLAEAPRAAATDISDARFVDYQNRTQTYFDAADRNHGWVGQQGLPLVNDPLAVAARLSENSSMSATRSLETTAKLGITNADPEARQILAGSMNEAVRTLAAMIASLTYEGDSRPVATTRLAGDDRIKTGVRVSQEGFPAGAPAAVVVNSQAWPDGLSAGPLASALQGPILLVKRDGMSPDVKNEIIRLGAKRVLIIGGERVVSRATAASIDALPGVTVERVAGSDRSATSALVAKRIHSIVGHPIERAFIVSASRFADSLSVSPIASARLEPILLAPVTGLLPVSRSALTDMGVTRLTIVGGTTAVSAVVQSQLKSTSGIRAVERIAGDDRYATSAAVRDVAVQRSWLTSDSVAVATGLGFADALSVGPLLGTRACPLLLTRHTRLPGVARISLGHTGPDLRTLTIIGGELAVSGLVERDVQNAVTRETTPPDLIQWTPPTAHYGHTADYDGELLDCYYIDLKSARKALAIWPRDTRGVIMVSYNGGPLVYNPVTVGLNALSCYEAVIHTGDEQARKEFLINANWLRDTVDSQGRLPYQFFIGSRALYPPWYSAMAQGYGMSALLRAWQLTGDISYKNAAQAALKPMLVSVDNEGVGYSIGPNVWLEEYPDKHHVLNGWVFASWGVWDLYRSTGDATALSVWQATTKTLQRTMDDYEAEDRVLYEVKPGKYSGGYHLLQVNQMRILGEMTGMHDITARGDAWTLMYSTADSHASPSVQAQAESSEIDPLMGISPDLLAPVSTLE